jgi:hypothetical protein
MWHYSTEIIRTVTSRNGNAMFVWASWSSYLRDIGYCSQGRLPASNTLFTRTSLHRLQLVHLVLGLMYIYARTDHSLQIKHQYCYWYRRNADIGSSLISATRNLPPYHASEWQFLLLFWHSKYFLVVYLVRLNSELMFLGSLVLLF